MAIHTRRRKIIEFALGATQFECQISNWNIANNTEDGDKIYSYCPDGEDVEETDDDYALELTFWSDWRSGGLSDYLVQNDKETVAFTLDHLPDIPAEHVTWTGNCVLKAPNVGGEARTTETQEVSMRIIGKPAYTRETP